MYEYEYDEFFIGGHWVAPAGDGTVEIISPATEEAVAVIPEATEADIDAAVSSARAAWDRRTWRDLYPAERGRKVLRLAEVLDSRADDIARRVTLEMGQPMALSARSQRGAIGLIRSFVDALDRIVFEERRTGPAGPALVRREGVGVAAAISPWNGPFFLSAVKVAPALLAGCSVIAKPADNTPLSGYVLAEAAAEADLPEGVLSVVPAGREAGAHLVAHPGVNKVSFTGSTDSGRKIAAVCGEQLKRVSLELGGKSAAIALDDVDIETLVPALVAGSFYNTGQACTALTRLVVHRSRYDEVVEAMAQAAKNMVVGDPLDQATQIGPLATAAQRNRVEAYIGIGKSEGARLVHGGGRPAHLPKGYFVEPTVFADVRNDMRIAQEEIFGPVLSVLPYDGTDDDAIAIANDSKYGLHGAVFTPDRARAEYVAARVESGTFTINGYVNNPAAPFGGVKGSGIGREFGAEGIDEFLEYHTINDPAAA
ncbi:betaine-aldehyde dehydrogenase [Amycolatopsis bartoniae]|uniref:aldehyde dehydrogenase (NAD(+)) n=1 Tax=Amycolatopsis bartoniae TaxID=941986 RepID=A0A8H9ISN8_9PSEU|nr:aldehyde dehydrogenase [Amycolatopsis bartoniae]MBB2939672.1 betaine-aldehyde dehydrogenase [Amycolatopsis bartoniae]TVT06206.1 aldehyde dehydrogenase [Amycolatopsis bartoniae]GHF36617.1 putative aldehyde dehydrogenase [Amycolatopsis bartoniae]